MKKISAFSAVLLLVLLASCDLQISNSENIFDSVKPEIEGSSGNSEVVGSDIVIKADAVDGYKISRWIVTYSNGTVEEVEGETLSMPVDESGKYSVSPVYELVESSPVQEEMQKAMNEISSKVFNQILPVRNENNVIIKNVFTIDDIIERKSDINKELFYVNVGKVADSIDSVAIFHNAYGNSDNLTISIGMSSFIRDLAYKVDENGNLLLSSIALYLSNVYGDYVVVNDSIRLSYTDTSIVRRTLEYGVLGYVQTHGNPTDYVSLFDKDESAVNTFNVDINCGKDSLRYWYEGAEYNEDRSSSGYGLNIGDSANDIILTRTTTEYNGKSTETFSIDIGKDKGYYLNGYYGHDEWVEGKVSKTERYTCVKQSIILDSAGMYKGEFTVTFNINPAEPPAGH